MSTARTDAGAVPEIHVDEICPPPRPTPDAWVAAKDGAYVIENPDDYDDDDPPHRLSHGETMKFSRLYTYPDAVLTFTDTGWRCDPPAPDGAEHVMVDGDPETMIGEVEELAEYLRESGDGNPGDEHVVKFYTWTDEIWSFDAEAGKFARGAA